MSKKVNSSDTITDSTLHEILLNMDARLKHIEDISADNRAIIVKLVKQGNQIVKFLQQIEVEDITDEFEDISTPPLTEGELKRANKIQHMKDMIEEYMEKHKDLKELEKELQKHKDEITPGQVGES